MVHWLNVHTVRDAGLSCHGQCAINRNNVAGEQEDTRHKEWQSCTRNKAWMAGAQTHILPSALTWAKGVEGVKVSCELLCDNYFEDTREDLAENKKFLADLDVSCENTKKE